MFDMVLKMTADEILIINGLQKVAEEAREDAKKIAEAYHFGIGEEIIEVWHDRERNNFEYLTHEGIWQARYLHQTYDVKIDQETLFDYYRAEWLIENGYVTEYENKEFSKKGFISRYLRSFVRRIE